MQSRSPPRDSESHLPISPETAVQHGRGVQPPPSKGQLMRGQQQGRTLGCPLCEDIRHGKSSPPQISSMAPGSPSLQSPQSSPFPPIMLCPQQPWGSPGRLHPPPCSRGWGASRPSGVSPQRGASSADEFCPGPGQAFGSCPASLGWPGPGAPFPARCCTGIGPGWPPLCPPNPTPGVLSSGFGLYLCSCCTSSLSMLSGTPQEPCNKTCQANGALPASWCPAAHLGSNMPGTT